MVAVANSLDEISIDWKWLDEILVPTLGEVVSTVGAMCECITRWVLIVAVCILLVSVRLVISG